MNGWSFSSWASVPTYQLLYMWLHSIWQFPIPNDSKQLRNLSSLLCLCLVAWQMAMSGGGGGIGELLKTTLADGLMTFLFVFCVSTLGPLTSLILASPLYDSLITFLKSVTPPPNLIVTTLILFVFLLILTTIASLLGGASFNPTSTIAFHTAGFKPNSLISMSLRFPAQALGAVAGAVSITSLMPVPYNQMLPGPRLKVDMHIGGFAECVLTFLVCFGILWIVTRGPNNPVFKVAMISLTTVTLVISGSKYTGPAMNPANVSSSSVFFL